MNWLGVSTVPSIKRLPNPSERSNSTPRPICSRRLPGRRRTSGPGLRMPRSTRDRNLRLQYLAGFGLNLYRANEIYRSMVAYGPRMPKELFTGSQPSLEVLAKLIESGRFR